MSQKSSTFVRQTRERESWLTSGDSDPQEAEQNMAVAALARGVMDSIVVPEGAEEKSRARAVAEMNELRIRGLQGGRVAAPWYLKLGHALRYVFTFGRRR